MSTYNENALMTFEIDTASVERKTEKDQHIPSCIVKYEILSDVSNIDARIEEINASLYDLNVDIDRLTNHADLFDYSVAVASGILSGLIDSFCVGEFHPDSADKMMEKFAAKRGWTSTSNKSAQEFLEEKFHTSNDAAYQRGKDIFGKKLNVGGTTHRFDDLAHHPTLIGLVASIMVRMLRLDIFINAEGDTHIVPIKTNGKDIVKIITPVVMTGLFMWIANVAEKYSESDFGEELPKPLKKLLFAIKATPAIITIISCADDWFGHIMSDIATPTGIPGTFLSFLKYISAIPIIRKTPLPKIVEKIYKDSNMGFASELKQSLPVILNEIFVRGFYFIRHLSIELKENKSFKNVDWHRTIPVGNRTVERMMTIASGTFTAVDLADAAIHGAAKSGGTAAGFFKEFVLCVNFVGIGRFAIAVGTDVGMGISRAKKINERIALNNELIYLSEAKIYYKNQLMWASAKNATVAVNDLNNAIELLSEQITEDFINIQEDIENISKIDSNKISDADKTVFNDYL